MPNPTHLRRAARKLQSLTELSYQQALTLLRSAAALPDLDDPIQVAAFVSAARPRSASPAATEGAGDDATTLLEALVDEGPSTVRFHVESGDGRRLSSELADEAEARSLARSLGERLVRVETDAEGSLVDDALVFDYALGGPAELDDGEGAWCCGECGAWITGAESQSDEHLAWCSLHPDNEVGMPAPVPAASSPESPLRRHLRAMHSVKAFEAAATEASLVEFHAWDHDTGEMGPAHDHAGPA